MCVSLCLGGNNTTWMNTSVLVTCIRNFRRNRGPVSGILKGFVGLSTAIFTDLCSAFFSDDPATFLLMLALVPFFVCLAAVFFLREIPPATTLAEEKEEGKYSSAFNVVAVVVAFLLLAYDFTPNPTRGLSLGFGITLLVLLASPLAVPVHKLVNGLRIAAAEADIERVQGAIDEPLLRDSTAEEKAVEAAEEDGEEVTRKPVIGEEHTIGEEEG
ncbi:unnamed protein product [Linum tenue]|uniref:Nodulin-like domain-containing protein n=1 Tax=Linum tenue TaxID=586396 RepID=A0AAV0N6G3_9ROSI|nr:unnamed protein product [Linum tenue]CAI0454216.1 unnamed protein product [Linum tenue]